ncbi:MAG TPA: nitroreductase/quinone reductase family protein [Acidimicrobiia bacterium]|jgi:deazaflavin-dependent oxidoreductase (nitroreductase family)
MTSRSARTKRYLTLRGTPLRYWVRIHIWVYRTTHGRALYRMRGMPSLLLTTTGRRSGRAHTVPLPYFTDADGSGKVVVGSFAGSDHDPAWVLNLRGDPSVRIQDRAEVYPARATVLERETRAPVWERVVAAAPWYANYQTATSREIPLVRLERTEPADGGA